MTVSANDEKREGSGQPNRAFTPARIVALVVIGVVVLALGYIHVSSGDDAVSVPSGAKAGDLILDDCSYATENGSYDADCGTLVVPENRHKADSRLIALPVTRIHARSAHPAEPIFRLQGSPGVTNMAFPAASRFAGRHDGHPKQRSRECYESPDSRHCSLLFSREARRAFIARFFGVGRNSSTPVQPHPRPRICCAAVSH